MFARIAYATAADTPVPVDLIHEIKVAAGGVGSHVVVSNVRTPAAVYELLRDDVPCAVVMERALEPYRGEMDTFVRMAAEKGGRHHIFLLDPVRPDDLPEGIRPLVTNGAQIPELAQIIVAAINS